ncbi:hypothetical protein DPMN_150831 [Dreissena polymorpha]|uniref:Uncharacterized protein n=1 Tax=Dreissena polymorpha TaxID=45954 RepID=A0A9D4J5Y4_DREPO|nr:hypothetical protein DPMN_150831 [Dreissena polymorpha]
MNFSYKKIETFFLTLYFRVFATESSSDTIDLIVRIVIGTVVGAVGLVVCVIGIIVFCKILGKKKKVKPTSNNAAANDAVYANSGYIHTADQSASNNGAGNVDTSTAGGNVNTLTAEGNVNTSTAGGNVTTSTAEGNASTSTVGVTPPAGHSFGTTYHLPPITSNARNSS